MSYANDRSWSDQFIPDIQAKVGPILLSPAPFHADAQQATDLMILQARDIQDSFLASDGMGMPAPTPMTSRSEHTGTVVQGPNCKNCWTGMETGFSTDTHTSIAHS